MRVDRGTAARIRELTLIGGNRDTGSYVSTVDAQELGPQTNGATSQTEAAPSIVHSSEVGGVSVHFLFQPVLDCRSRLGNVCTCAVTALFVTQNSEFAM